MAQLQRGQKRANRSGFLPGRPQGACSPIQTDLPLPSGIKSRSLPAFQAPMGVTSEGSAFESGASFSLQTAAGRAGRRESSLTIWRAKAAGKPDPEGGRGPHGQVFVRGVEEGGFNPRIEPK